MRKISVSSLYVYISIIAKLSSPCHGQDSASSSLLSGGVIEINSLLNTKGIISPDMQISVPNANGRAFGFDVMRDTFSKFKSMFTGEVMESTYRNFTTRFGHKMRDNSKSTFLNNILAMFQHNMEALGGKLLFTKGVNAFSDMTLDEVREKFTGGIVLNASTQTGRSIIAENESPSRIPPYHALISEQTGRSIAGGVYAPEEMDWRKHGKVTKPKNQGECRSCTCFALTAGLESAMAIYKGVNNFDLSEQELLDCPTGPGIFRCEGNFPEDIFEYQKTYGQTFESSYPYLLRDTPCRARGTPRVAKVTGYFKAPPGDENALKAWVGVYGVHSAVIQVEDALVQYNGGIMDAPCDNSRFDHSVLIVGYGTENGQDYWIIKNSWGEEWGELGYVRIARNKGSLCRIADYAILIQA